MISLKEITTHEKLIQSIRNGEHICIIVDMLKGYGPVLLNRDKSGQEKSITIGGAPRTLVTSQCIKHAVRHAYDESHMVRTRRIPVMVGDALKHLKGIDENSDEYKAVVFVTEQVLDNVDILSHGGINEIICKQAMCFDRDDFTEMAEIICRSSKEYISTFAKAYDATRKAEKASAYSKAAKEFLKGKEAECIKTCKAALEDIGEHGFIGIERSLFGNFSTDKIVRTVNGALYMNHAYSVNETFFENDFYTAVEECIFDGEKDIGCANMGYTSVTAPILYQTMRIDVSQYFENILTGLEKSDENVKKKVIEDGIRAVGEFIKIYCLTSPEAKQHPMYSNPRPLAVALRISHNSMECTMDDAFQMPMSGDIADRAVSAMAKFLTDSQWGNKKTEKYWISSNYTAEGAKKVTLDEAIEAVTGAMRSVCN